MTMEKSKLKHFRNLLIKHEKEYENTLNNMRENQSASQDRYSNGELSAYDNHPAELGTQLYDLEQNMALMVHEEHLLKDVHDALIKIDHNSYGNCEFCGKDIGEERLEAIPYARLCIHCEKGKHIDPEFLRSNRPTEERFTWDAPFGRKYLNAREDDENEGLDYLNDLVKYGSSDSPQDMGGYHDYDEYYTNEIDKQGIVDDMDQVTNEEYKRQLPD